MTRFLIICLFNVLLITCNNNKISGDLSVNVELLDVGNVEFCQCDKNYFNSIVKISIQNNSNIQKSFWMMSCSWEECFTSNRDDISFCNRECDGNFPIEIKLSPEQNITFNGVLKQRESEKKSESFRIGLIILEKNDYYDFNKKSNPKYKLGKRTYWSNQVTFDYKGLGYKLSK